MRLHPFLIIVDDGGFDRAIEDDDRSSIGLDTYERVAELASRYGIRIPVCFTVKHLDKHGRSDMAQPLPYLEDLLHLLDDRASHIEFGYHGLTHEHQGGAEEFFDLRRNCPVPEAIQRQHMEVSRQILADCSLSFPRLFVPPYNAWEQGVTDRLAAEFGVRYLVAYRSMRYQGHRYRWHDSPHVEFLPRASLGLNGRDYDVDEGVTRTLRFVPGTMSIVDFMKRHIVPQPLGWRVRISRSLMTHPVHSYMTHIGNFSQRAMSCWYRLFDYVLAREDLKLCRTSEEAVGVYRTLASGTGND